jgi:acetyl-CoA carboxylase biotin carboxyl carrier protein
MSLSSSDIRVIVDALQESDWDQATVVVGDVRIAVSRRGLPLPGESTPAATPPRSTVPAAAVPATDHVPPQPAPPTPAAPAAAPATVLEGHVITSPSVGVFWRAPEPGAAPFVEVGRTVQVGDTIGIVEVMKLMSNVAADVAGEVVAVHVDNAAAVEFGTPLVTIRPGTAG